MCAKHAWRLRRLGWSRALSPPDGGIWAAGDPPPREGCSLDVLIDGAAGVSRPSPRRSRTRATTSTSPGGTSRRTSSSCGASEAAGTRAAAGRGGRAGRRPGARVGRGAGARVSPHPQGSARGGRAADPRHPDSLRDRSPRASVHCHHEKTVIVDGEVAFVGGIDMTDLRGRSLRHERPSGPPAPRLARRGHAGSRARGDRRARPLRAALARADRRGAGAAGSSPGAAGEHTVQVVRTIAEGMYDIGPRRRVPHPRELRARDRAGRAVHLPGEPVPVGARDRPVCSPRSCAGRRATSSGSWSSSPRGPTTATTTPWASSGCSSAPTTTQAVCSPRRSARSPAIATTASTCTRRWASSTTAG